MHRSDLRPLTTRQGRANAALKGGFHRARRDPGPAAGPARAAFGRAAGEAPPRALLVSVVRGCQNRCMEFRLLGPVEVIDNGVPLALGARQRALVAVLLVHANQVVSAERLIDIAAAWIADRRDRYR